MQYGLMSRNNGVGSQGQYQAEQRIGLSFYIASSDKDILAKVSDIMRGQGYIGIADMGGRIQYIVDGRNNLYSTVHQIRKLADQSLDDGCLGWDTDDNVLRRSVETVLHQYQIPRSLKGFQLLRYMLVLGARDETIMRPVNKVLYPKAAEHFQISCHQVDRIVRYATKQAGINEGNASFMIKLRDEIVEKYLKSIEYESSESNLKH